MNTQILIVENGKGNSSKKKGYSIQIWVEEISSWLVFDNFKTKKRAKEFLDDKKEMEEVRLYIERVIKEKKENESTEHQGFIDKRSVSGEKI